MSAGILLIDGYNLLHAAGMGQKDYRPGDLLRCRTRLLKFLLGKLSTAEIHATTVVFDARDPPPDRPAQVVVSGIRVLFANPGGDADVLIQNWLSHHPTPRRVTLVSGDRALQRAARSSGAKFVGSRDFIGTLESRKGRKQSWEADDRSLRERHASPEQVAHWLKVFGEVPLVEPDDDSPSQATVPKVSAPRPKATSGTGHSRRSKRKRPSMPGSKATEDASEDELAYWMGVFGESATGAGAESPDGLRLSDLENWLKEFEANEGKAENRGSGC
jgi:predicted RNA-binding protein with PIN domain